MNREVFVCCFFRRLLSIIATLSILMPTLVGDHPNRSETVPGVPRGVDLTPENACAVVVP